MKVARRRAIADADADAEAVAVSKPSLPALRRLVRDRNLIALIALAAFGLLIPIVDPGVDTFLWETILIQVLFTQSVNLLIGHSGIGTFGQAAFFGTGAYTVAVAGTHVPAPYAFLLGILTAGLVAIPIGFLVTRISGTAIAMLTLAIAQGAFVLIDRSNAFGGDNGMLVDVKGFFSPVSIQFWDCTVLLTAAVLGGFLLLLRSPLGLVLHALRDDPWRLLHMGIRIRWFRLLAFVLSGAMGGAAGGVFALVNQSITPEAFDWPTSGAPLIMAVIGGLYTFWGPVVGAVIYMLLNQYFTDIAPSIWILFVGLVLLGIVLVSPEGLLSLPSNVRRWIGLWRRE